MSPPSELQHILDIQPTVMIETYFQCHPSVLRSRKTFFYNLTPQGPDNQLFFINSSENWKVSSSLLELEGFILTFKTGKFHPCSINRSAKRFYPRTSIRRLYAGGKKLESLILAFWAARFHLCSIHVRARMFHPRIANRSHW